MYIANKTLAFDVKCEKKKDNQLILFIPPFLCNFIIKNYANDTVPFCIYLFIIIFSALHLLIRLCLSSLSISERAHRHATHVDASIAFP